MSWTYSTRTFTNSKIYEGKKLFWIDEDKKNMRQGNWSRPISSPGFFLEEKIDWMKKTTLIMLVMLCLSQLYCNGWKKMTV